VTALTPHDAFERFQQSVLSGDAGYSDDALADDVVIELPFARPGTPGRFESRAAFLAFAEQSREALPVQFEEFRNVVVHDTVDPEVIIAEYELAGIITTTGQRASAPFVLMLRVHDGKVVHVREYQNPLALAEALAS
jgi:ketosteroid isomerase-like protein